MARQGSKNSPVFPGYIFFEYEAPFLPPSLIYAMRHSPYFIRFLPNNECPQALNLHDSEIIRHFINFGSLIPPSLVRFDENQKIKVIERPLTRP